MGCAPSLAAHRACVPADSEAGRLEELFAAARAGDTGAVSALLDNGFYVDCADRVRARAARRGAARSAARSAAPLARGAAPRPWPALPPRRC